MSLLLPVIKGTTALTVVFALVGVGGGVKGCVMADNPDDLSPSEKWTVHTLGTLKDMFGVTQDLAKESLEKGIEGGGIRRGVTSTLEVIEGVTIEAAKGVGDYIEKKKAEGGHEEPLSETPEAENPYEFLNE